VAIGRAGGLLVLLAGALCSATGAAADAQRIVTLAPHLGELVYDAGAGERLVGVIAYSDFPPEARELPRVGDAFGVKREVVAGLRPDLILAWDGFTPPAIVASLEEDGHRVVVIGARTPEDVADALLAIARLTGTEATARPAAERYRRALAALADAHAAARPIRVFVQLAARPLYTVSDRQMIGQVVRLCGGENVFGGLDGLTPVVGPEAVVAADPEVMLGTGDDGAADPWSRWREFPTLTAVAAGQLYAVNADHVTRPSLRLARGAAEICDYLDRARAAGVPAAD
jgi:iron complex transport system substrate-binding protein